MCVNRKCIAWGAALALSLQSAHAWEPSYAADGVLGEYVESLKADGKAVFISNCQVGDRLKATLVVPIGQPLGHLFLVTDKIQNGRAFAAMTGTIDLASNTPKAEWIKINPKSRDSLDQIASNLVASPFWVLPADQLEKIFSENAPELC